MKQTKQQHIDLMILQLGDFAAAGKINVELMGELVKAIYWADSESKKENTNYDLESWMNVERAKSNFNIDALLSGDRLSIKLKEFVHSMLIIPLNLLPARLSFTKNKIGTLTSKLSELRFLKLLRDKIDGYESHTLELLVLLNDYSDCRTEDELEGLIDRYKSEGKNED